MNIFSNADMILPHKLGVEIMYTILVTPQNRNQYLTVMDEVYQLRCKVFNNFMGWNLPIRSGREEDEFDKNALHFVVYEDDGVVVGTWRIMPTTATYMSQKVFPDFFEETGIISSPEVWELSRFAVERDIYKDDKEQQSRVMGALTSAVMEFAILHGIAEMLSVQNSYITPIANKFLGTPLWQSKTIDAGKTDATCYSYEPSLLRLYALRTQFKLPSPVISQYQIAAFQKAA